MLTNYTNSYLIKVKKEVFIGDINRYRNQADIKGKRSNRRIAIKMIVPRKIRNIGIFAYGKMKFVFVTQWVTVRDKVICPPARLALALGRMVCTISLLAELALALSVACRTKLTF